MKAAEARKKSESLQVLGILNKKPSGNDAVKEEDWRKERLVELKLYCDKAWKPNIGKTMQLALINGWTAEGILIEVASNTVAVSNMDAVVVLQKELLTEGSKAFCYKDSFIEYYSLKQLDREAATKPWR